MHGDAPASPSLREAADLIRAVFAYDKMGVGWSLVLDAAQAALQDVIGPPSHLPPLLEAVKELFGETSAFHPVQGSHLVEESGSLLLESGVIFRHGYIMYYSTQLCKQKKENPGGLPFRLLFCPAPPSRSSGRAVGSQKKE